jgi:hypothetical protein
MLFFAGHTVFPVSLTLPMGDRMRFIYGELSWQIGPPSGLSLPLPYFLPAHMVSSF